VHRHRAGARERAGRGVLAVGARIEVRGTTVTVESGDTFATVARKVIAQGTPAGVADVAVAAQADDGVLVAQASLAITGYVVAPGDTVKSVLAYSSAFDLEHLALLAGPSTADVYPAGTALVVGSRTVVPQPGDTFAALADETGVDLDLIAVTNRTAPLRQGRTAGHSRGRDPPRRPGRRRDGAVRRDVAADVRGSGGAFGVDAAELGRRNATMPGLLRAGVRIAFPGHAVTTDSSSTLASLAQECGVDVATFAADVGRRPRRPGRTRRDRVGAAAEGGQPFAGDPGADLEVPADDLAAANTALVGFVAPDRTVTVGGASVTSNARDTLASLLRRLRAQDPALTMADLVAACGKTHGLLRASAAVLVPPARVAVAAPCPIRGSPRRSRRWRSR
jgi:hypothetical protein